MRAKLKTTMGQQTNPTALSEDRFSTSREPRRTEMTNERSYRRPSRLRVHFFDPLARFMIGRGLAPGGNSQDGSGMRVLEVRGRKTGRWYQRPVVVGAVDGRRYIVSLWGESQWARNLRANAAAKLRVGSRIEPIEGHELKN